MKLFNLADLHFYLFLPIYIFCVVIKIPTVIYENDILERKLFTVVYIQRLIISLFTFKIQKDAPTNKTPVVIFVIVFVPFFLNLVALRNKFL